MDDANKGIAPSLGVSRILEVPSTKLASTT